MSEPAADARPKATLIRVEFDDGRVLGAWGADAHEIWRWWMSCEFTAANHGAGYAGPKLVRYRDPDAKS